jgi:hypothetical protein
MAGHRIRAGKPKSAITRNKAWRTRIAAAATTEQMYDVASDWLRSSANRHQDVGHADQVLDEAARYLMEQADNLDRRTIEATSMRQI